MMSMDDATKCNTNHNATSLSYFSASVSILLLIMTLPINILFLVVLMKNSKLLKQSMFYKLICNIIIADLLTSFISDPTSVSFLLKEGLGFPVSMTEVYLVHVSLFVINGASILTMTLLCIDRTVALLKPIRYRNGLSTYKSVLLLISTWIIAGLLSIPYFYVGYIKHLKYFSFITVSITFAALLAVAIVHRVRLKPKKISDNLSSNTHDEISSKNEKRKEYKGEKKVDKDSTLGADSVRVNKGFEMGNDVDDKQKDKEAKLENVTVATRGSDIDVGENMNKRIYAVPNRNLPTVNIPKPSLHLDTGKIKKLSFESRVNKSFIILLLVFLATYLPAAVMIIYMNFCHPCDCISIHIMRDLTYLCILSSAFWRPLNFVLRLKTIKKEMHKLLCRKSVDHLSSDSAIKSGSVVTAS